MQGTYINLLLRYGETVVSDSLYKQVLDLLSIVVGRYGTARTLSCSSELQLSTVSPQGPRATPTLITALNVRG